MSKKKKSIQKPVPAPEPPPEKKIGLQAALLCAIVILIVFCFLPTLQNDFTQWDDPEYVTENPVIKKLSGENLKTIFTKPLMDLYTPLTLVTFALEYHLVGLKPLLYHLNNLFLHIGNCLLVFWLIMLLSRNNFAVAAITTLLFGIHPLRVESVAWITERKDVLFSLFFLASLIAYIFYRKIDLVKIRKIAFYSLSLLLFLLSLLAKPQALPFALVLLLFDYYHFREFSLKNLIDKIPFVIIAGVIIIVNVFPSEYMVGVVSQSMQLPSWHNILNVTYGLVFYAEKLIFPVNLACLYPHPDKAGGIAHALFLLSPAFVAALVAAIVLVRKRLPDVAFASLFFLVNLMMVLKLVPSGPAIVADRYSYIPSILFLYLAASGIVHLYYITGRYRAFLRPAIVIAMTAVVVIFCGATRAQCAVWKNNWTLWSDVLAKYPMVDLAHVNLGILLKESGNHSAAIDAFNEALRINPGNELAYTNLGIIFAEQGLIDRALASYTKAITINKHSLEAYLNRGNAYLTKNNLDSALISYHQAQQINPRLAKVHYNIGVVLSQKGNPHEAAQAYNRALQIDPGFTLAHTNLGIFYAGQGKMNEALEQFEIAVRLEPHNSRNHLNQGIALAESGKTDQAIAALAYALRLEPGLQMAQDRLTLLQKDNRKVIVTP